MDITGLTRGQIQALLDLLIVGMYADGNLTSAEDARIETILDAIPFHSDYERQTFSDAAFTRARRKTSGPEGIRGYVTELGAQFPTPETRQKAYDILQELLASDGDVTAEENRLLAAAREVFQL